MSQKEESLDEKIARIRKQNEAIERRKKMIDEEIKDAAKNNALVQLKVSPVGNYEDGNFEGTLYSDQLSPEKKTVNPVGEDISNVKPKQRKSAPQPNTVDEAWREERKRIDEERIQRQKANSGSWKREWDANKIASSNESDNEASNKFDRSSSQSDAWYSFSNESDNQISKKFDRSSSQSDRLKTGGYSFNELKGAANHSNKNENDTSQRRLKTDNTFRKTRTEQRALDNYDNRKSILIKSDTWRNVPLDADTYNNNGTRLYSRNVAQTTPVTAKGDQFDEESWDGKFTHDNIATKLHSKNNWRTATNVTPTTPTTRKQPKETRDVEPDEKAPVVEPKPNEYWAGGDAKPRTKIEESWSSRSSSNLSHGFGTPVTAPSANTWTTIPVDNDLQRSHCSRKNTSFNKEMQDIVVQVKNLGTTSNEREVKLKKDSKSEVPKFNVNLSRGGEVDAKTSPSYSNITFQRSDLKQQQIAESLESFSSSTSIDTQMFSNSKMNDANCFTGGFNSMSNSCSKTSNNWQKFVCSIQSHSTSALFNFSATPVKPNFGDIAHDSTNPQNANVKTIKSDNLTPVRETPKIRLSVKELTKVRGNDEFRRPRSVEFSPNQGKKTNKSIKSEVPESSQVYLGDDEETDEEEWADCSDEEVKEEFL